MRSSSRSHQRPLIALAQQVGRTKDSIPRQDLMRLYAMEAAAGYTQLQVAADRQAGRPPGPATSLADLDGVRRARASRDLALPSSARTAR